MTIDIDLRCDLCVWYNFPLELVDFLSSQLEICGMFEKSLKENEDRCFVQVQPSSRNISNSIDLLFYPPPPPPIHIPAPTTTTTITTLSHSAVFG